MKQHSKKIDKQIERVLRDKFRQGESRHEAKKNDLNYEPFKVSIKTIHSNTTMNNYRQVSNEFADWCIKEHKINKYTLLTELKPLAKEYLKYREKNGYKLATIKRDRAGLGKLFGERIEYKPKADNEFSRSRHQVVRDKNFNEKHHEDLCNIAYGTGLRRHEIAKLTAKSFSKEGNRLYFETKGKGGRYRKALVLPEYVEKIERFLETKRDSDKLFNNVNSNADIHSMRRNYATSLYNNIVKDEDLRNDVAKLYPNRSHFETVKSEYYSTRSGRHFEGRRDDIYLISQSLGHNRLNDTIKHYLT